MISRFIAIYHVISRQITPKQQATTTSTKPRGLFAKSPQSTITRPAAPRRTPSGHSTTSRKCQHTQLLPSDRDSCSMDVPRRPGEISVFGTPYLYRWQRRHSEALQVVWWQRREPCVHSNQQSCGSGLFDRCLVYCFRKGGACQRCPCGIDLCLWKCVDL